MNTVRVVIHYSAFEAALLFGAGYLTCYYLSKEKKEKEESESTVVYADDVAFAEKLPKKKSRKITYEDGKLIFQLRKDK